MSANRPRPVRDHRRHTLSSNCDHTFFLNESYSPFFLIVCKSPSIVDFCVALNGSSEVLNRLRGRTSGSSSARLLPIVSTEAMMATVMRWRRAKEFAKQMNREVAIMGDASPPGINSSQGALIAAKHCCQDLS